jgi:isoleucyl-tRNA synthetase
LEGKDQIRGWFNLLHVLSVVVFGQRSFNAAYMHGFINDSMGRKMSKSLGNYILPAEVTDKYGADVMRLYMTSGAAPALDLNYNFKDLDGKMKNTKVFWNLHKWVFDTADAAEVDPMPLNQLVKSPAFGLEEKYVFARLNSTIAQMTQYVSEGDYRLNEFPIPVESFLLDVLSHTYLQLTWEKASSGSDEEKAVTVSVVYHSLVQAMTLLAPVMPFFSEEVYRNLRGAFDGLGAKFYPEESVHLCPWPVADPSLLNPQLEKDMDAAKDAITAVLGGRDKIGVGVKWPLQEVRVNVTLPGYLPSLQRCEQLILQRTGVKKLNFEPLKVDVEVRPNSKVIGKQFGSKTQAVLAYIQNNASALASWVEKTPSEKHEFAPDAAKPSETLTLTSEHLIVKRNAPENYTESSGQFLQVFLNTVRTPELDQEGYLREVTRRVQMLRKKLSLKRKDKVNLFVAVDPVAAKLVHDAVTCGKDFLVERAGVNVLRIVSSKAEFGDVPADFTATEKVKQFTVDIAVQPASN